MIFDNDLYVKLQSAEIRKRIDNYDKLYLEFGGKLFDDFHASRVLPGFHPDSKIKMLCELKDITEIIFCINAGDIERKKIRADFGITYDVEVLRLIDEFSHLGLSLNSVVITLYKGQPSATLFKNKLEQRGIRTYIHTPTLGYPTDIDVIVSESGYGANPYIETTKPLVVVTAPGPASGKLATCLSQLYHDYKHGIKAGYSKFETFPVWNLALKHPINLAYEAATADLNDVNMIDSFHLEKYGIPAVNYNRDIEVFPVLRSILFKIMGLEIYHSPTDMGVNMIGFCIKDDDGIKNAAKKEIIRRYYKALCEHKTGNIDFDVSERIKLLMNELNINPLEYRNVIAPCLEKSKIEDLPVISLELPNKKIITGKKTELLSPASSIVLNAIKELTKIPDDIFLLSPNILDPILKQRRTKSKDGEPLNLQEVLIALSICSATNPMVEKALHNLDKLEGCQAHASYIVYNGDLKELTNLGIQLTCEPVYYSRNLYTND